MKYHKHLLQSCVDALDAIFNEGRYADKCIEFNLKKNKKWGSRDRRFFAETVYDCVRWWSLDLALLQKEPGPISLDHLSVSFWRRGYPLPEMIEFKAVSEVDFEQRLQKVTNPSLRQAFPQWLYDLGLQELGEFWHELAGYLNHTNQLVIRANTSKISVKDLLIKLNQADIPAKALIGTEQGILIPKRVNVFRTELFKKGLFEVQDGSSQQVATYIDVRPGMRVVDACAGAGGKSLHIADLMENRGKVIALDIHQWKLDQLKLRARRNSYSNIEMRVLEGTKTIKRLKATADRLLLDVPCSGLGVLRRNPDTKWKLSANSLVQVRETQKTILFDYESMLKPGGKLLYSTCSILPSENQQQIQNFLDQHPNYTLLKQRHLYPTRSGFDGFYMALLQKNKS